MAKRTCSNGHIYDSSIYGDNCPFCPSNGGGGTQLNDIGGGTVHNDGNGDGHTHLNDFGSSEVDYVEPTGPTIPMGEGGQMGGGTKIHHVGDGTNVQQGRRLVGFLVSYKANPLGQAFNIYEGRNYVGSAATNDICIPKDEAVSRKHMSILYRAVDQKFKFRDEQSSNGTFVNEALEDEGELKDHDVIHIGTTYLIFIAIPQSL